MSKDLLNSKSFCVLLWVGLTINTKGEITPCCVNHLKIADSSELSKDPNEILGHHLLRDMRKQMMEGKLPESCEACNVPGKRTVREIKNSAVIAQLTEEEIQNIENTPASGEIADPKIVYADIRPSNICNLKCRTCSPGYSSRIHQEEKSEIKFPKPFKLSEFPDFAKSLKEIYFAGGEPLIDEEHYRALDVVPNETTLVYNTNFTRLQFKNLNVLDYWRERKTLAVIVSLDDVGERLSYLRHGSIYSDILSNFKEFHNKIPNSFDKIRISITVSVFNILNLGEIISEIENQGLVKPDKISLNFLEYPKMFKCSNYRSIIGADRLQESVIQIKHPLLRTQVENFLASNTDENLSLIESFLATVNEKDQLRNEKFEEFFPELARKLNRFSVSNK